MQRRAFISLLGGAASWPLAAGAQQPAMPVIGFLNSQSPGGYPPMAAAFHQGLREVGFVEGRNVAIEYRWAQGRNDRLRALAAELVRRHVTVIAAAGSSSALAAKAETATLPVVFSAAVDLVAVGLVASLNRPGGSVTGVTDLSGELRQKQVEMLHELAPTATVLAALLNPTFPGSETQSSDLQAAARNLGLQSMSYMPAPSATSTRPLRRWHNCEPVCSLSVPTRSSSVTATKSPPLPFVTGYPPFSSYASSPRLAA